jgi:hypothetical protein
MTRDEATRWQEALYGKKAKPVEQVAPTNIIRVPDHFWRTATPKKSVRSNFGGAA